MNKLVYLVQGSLNVIIYLVLGLNMIIYLIIYLILSPNVIICLVFYLAQTWFTLFRA